MSNKLIDIIDITKSYDENVILDKLNLYIRENEFLTLLGPSGCGKTTLLRILGGFETPDSGNIIFDGKNINSLPPNRRQLNTVFQVHFLIGSVHIAYPGEVLNPMHQVVHQEEEPLVHLQSHVRL